ncbi:cytochrome oxidase assembly protein 1 [Kalmusia sp. IMI 367209]|nr:cytochrome oxidase assembly protein 1 [Kalmusia sp. IMI 367209]
MMPSPRLLSPLLRSRIQLSHQYLRRIPAVRHASTTEQAAPPTVPWKTPHSITAWPPERLIPPPKDGEILLERKPNRDLPPVPPFIHPSVLRTLPIFIISMTIATLAFFNYQKCESSVVTSTLYALRTNPAVREQLGDEIYFASKYPWISGEINQVHGRIDIRFWVKGTRKQGEVRLRCKRRGKSGLYVTREWSLTLEDGTRMELYDPEGNAIDPFAGLDPADQ